MSISSEATTTIIYAKMFLCYVSQNEMVKLLQVNFYKQKIETVILYKVVFFKKVHRSIFYIFTV